MRKRKPLADRFFAKVNKTDNCWEWTAYTLYNGYGRFSYMGRTEYAHRVSWMMSHGEWPSGHVMHICDNPACVRPDHLVIGDMRTNIADRNIKHRQYSNKKEFCRHGMPFVVNENNRRIAKDCITCEITRNYASNASPKSKGNRAERQRIKAEKTQQSAQ